MSISLSHDTLAERSLKRHKSVCTPPLSRASSVKHFSRRRDRSPSYPLYLSDLDVSFSSSDLESLPDLSDDTTAESSPIVETKCATFPHHFFDLPVKKPSPPPHPSIFDIPEIVHKIVEFAHLQNPVVPDEVAPVRRRPLSFDHAMLIYGDKERAAKALQDPPPVRLSRSNILYTCLQINRLFHQAATEILHKKLYFNDPRKFHNFSHSISPGAVLRPTEFVLHKMFHMKQPALDRVLCVSEFSSLERLELFMCPKIVAAPEFFGEKLKSLVLTGSKTADDASMQIIAKRCPNLELLDVRASELITDAGLYYIATNCTKLTTINVGRKNKGHLITDASMSLLAKNNPNLATVGVAGCNVSDRFVWDLALNCSDHMERLSLNNCRYITNQSIPLILYSDYFPQLSVLELMNADQITNFRPIIEFKRRQEMKGISMLLEVCEPLCRKMRQQEIEMDRTISQRIFKNITEWANSENDGDKPFRELIASTRS